MKRSLAVLVGATLALVSCATVPSEPGPSKKIDVKVDSEKGLGLASIDIVPSWKRDVLFGEDGYRAFHGIFKNNTDKIIRIVWESSSISYSGSSSTIFIEGQRFINAGTPMTPTVIPARGTIEKDMFAATQAHFVSGSHGGWRMNNIPADDVILVLAIDGNGQEDYYTVTIGRH